MSGKPRLFLRDAGPVIGLHELGLWHDVLQRAEVIVPSIVADKEAGYWDDHNGARRPIDLRADAAAGYLQVASADAAEVAEVLRRFDVVMRERVDAGEAEALTILDRCEDHKPELCTADGAAVRAACLLGFADRIISLEAMLRRIGLDPPALRARYRERKLRSWVAEGRRMRIQGEGLS